MKADGRLWENAVQTVFFVVVLVRTSQLYSQKCSAILAFEQLFFCRILTLTVNHRSII